jgi:hypothetical protein
MTDPELAAAWDALHQNTPPGWRVGRPAYEPRHQSWSQYAWDATEKVEIGGRGREWTAVGQTELTCVREMAAAGHRSPEGLRDVPVL